MCVCVCVCARARVCERDVVYAAEVYWQHSSQSRHPTGNPIGSAVRELQVLPGNSNIASEPIGMKIIPL